MPPVISRSQYYDALREALSNLYNPYELKRSPLQALLDEQNPEQSIDLKQALIGEVHSLIPDEQTPYDTNEWKFYELLYYCYIDRLGQKEAAKTLLISLRTLQRLLPEAIVVLGEKLMSDYHLVGTDQEAAEKSQPRAEKPQPPAEETRSARAAPPGEAEAALPGAEEAWERETALLQASTPSDFIDIRKMLREIAQILQPFSSAGEGKVKVALPEATWLVAGQVTILRQAVLTAVSYFDTQESGLEIFISAEREGAQGTIHIQGQSRRAMPASPAPASRAEIPEAVDHLMSLLAGSAEIRQAAPSQRSILLTFPAQQQYKIMVIDDNADAIRLVKKYLSSGKYTVVGERDPEQVSAAVEKEQPSLILLDVMLPNIDGWMLLGQIRRSRQLARIPVIISTILPQEELSLTLGADGFLRKPYTQQELLHVLETHLLKNPM